MTANLRDSLLALALATTWLSGCSDDPAQTGTVPDSGSPLDVASEASPDVSSDHRPVDSPVDGAPCPEPGQQLVYDKPGCGVDVPAPVCKGVGDACGSVVCSCNGVTLTAGCEGAASPFAHVGACKDGGDASTDADGGTLDASDASDA